MQRSTWKPLTVFIVVWFAIVGLVTLGFLTYMFYDGSTSTDLGFAMAYAQAMTRPGPWNNGKPWTREQADARISEASRLFWGDVASTGRPYLPFVLASFPIGCAVVVASSRRACGAGGTDIRDFRGSSSETTTGSG
jgi:hypothetical protein